jgi:hypothetical protein
MSRTSDGTLIRWRAVLFASGVEWRRLDAAGVDDLLGAGVYYGAERGAGVHRFPGRRGGRRQLGGPGGRPVLPVRQGQKIVRDVPTRDAAYL